MFKIEGENYKKHGLEEEYTLTILPAYGERYLQNSLNINCNKIVVYKNSGIAFYMDEKVLMFKEAINCSIKYKYKKIDNTDYVLEDSFVIKLTNNITDEGNDEKSFMVQIDYPSFKRDGEGDKGTTRKYKIGDSVFPQNVPLMINGKETYYAILYNEILYNNSEDIIDNSEASAYLLDIVCNNTGKVVDIINCVKEKLYIIELDGKNVCATESQLTDSYEETRSISKFARWVKSR